MDAQFTIVYVSSSTRMISHQQQETLLQLSRENNKKADITGVLLYEGGNFFQVLEGPKSSVEATFERISQDPLHKGIITLLTRSFSERNFPNWSMAYARMTEEKFEEESQGFSVFLERDRSVLNQETTIHPSIKDLLFSYRKIVANPGGKGVYPYIQSIFPQ